MKLWKDDCFLGIHFEKCIQLCFITQCSLELTYIHPEQCSNSPNRHCLKMNEALVIMTESFHLFWFPAVMLVFELYLMTNWTRSDFWIRYCISILYYRSSVHGEYFHIYVSHVFTTISCNLTQEWWQHGCRWYQLDRRHRISTRSANWDLGKFWD